MYIEQNLMPLLFCNHTPQCNHFRLTFLFNILVKYLGLLAFSKILKTHPKSVQAHKDLILQCLDDRDESIRLRALDLLYGMVSVTSLLDQTTSVRV